MSETEAKHGRKKVPYPTAKKMLTIPVWQWQVITAMATAMGGKARHIALEEIMRRAGIVSPLKHGKGG